MESVKPSLVDNEEIVEIRERTNNEQSGATHHDSYRKPEPQTHVSVPQTESNVIDMAGKGEGTQSDKKLLPKDKKMKNKLRTPPQPGIKDDLTIIAHFSLAVYVIIICYLCFSSPFTFFTWHPLLLTIGVSLLIFITHKISKIYLGIPNFTKGKFKKKLKNYCCFYVYFLLICHWCQIYI